MRSHPFQIVLMNASALVLSGCEAVMELSPPGNSVYVTDQQIEIARCTPIGNIKLGDETHPGGNITTSEAEFRVRVAELGGNTGLVTSGTVRKPVEGVAFQCHLRAV